MKIKRKSKDGTSAALTNALNALTGPAKGSSQNPKKTKANSGKSIEYTVTIYGDSITKWMDKQATRIISDNDGMLVFEHKRPYSKSLVQEALPLTQVVQYGYSADKSSCWVFVKQAHTVIDSFVAKSFQRKGPMIEFDLGDGVKTLVNATVPIEIVGSS